MNDTPLLVDYRKGSVNLALHEPVRSLLSSCLECDGEIDKRAWIIDKSGMAHSAESCSCSCYGTGRTLSLLSSGDVSFIGNGADGPLSIGVEIKEITELLSSLISGRLQDTQMRGMLNDYDSGHRWILSYGRYRPSPVDGMIQIWKEGNPDRRNGWYTFKIKTRDKSGELIEKTVPYGYLEAFKCCSAREHGFVFDRVENIIEAAQWIGVLYRTWTRPYHTHKSMNVFDKSQDVRSKMKREQVEENLKSQRLVVSGRKQSDNTEHKRLMDRAAVFSQFPNIGYERAIAAAKKFPTIRAGVNATIDEWSEIEVVTKGKMERVIRLGKDIAAGVIKFLS